MRCDDLKINIKNNFTDHIRHTTCKCSMFPVTDEHTKIRLILNDINRERILFAIIRGISSNGYQQGTYLIYYDQEHVYRLFLKKKDIFIH